MAVIEDHERDPLEVLAADFIDRQRRGEHPAISEYTARHPELAAEIEDLFPTIVAVEQLKAHRVGTSSGKVSLGGARLERLGDFRILGEIGRGGMGIVYEAFQESLGRHVAVKVLPRQALLDPKQLERFQREAQTAARLHHSNIVPLFGVGEQDGFHYIVMQLIRGVSLDEVLVNLRQLRAADASSSNTSAMPSGSRGDVGCAETGTWSRNSNQNSKDGNIALINAPPSPREAGHNGSTTEAVRLARVLVEGRFWQDAERPGTTSSTSVRQSLGNDSGQATEAVASEVNHDSSATGRRFGPAYWRSVAAIGQQVAEALHYAHTHHTLHRDVKPANLLLDSQGVVWITDFGLAKVLDQDHAGQTAALAGTLRYMAPEQFSGRVDARSDVYSLGLTLYELATLQPAFADASRSQVIRKITEGQPVRPRQINRAIPRDLETIILKAIAHEPDHRYQSAAELAEDLQRFLEDRPIAARRASPFEQLWRWSRRNKALAALTTSTFVLLILFAVVATVGYVSTARERQRAEATSTLALDALDNIFRQFAPERTAAATGALIVDESGEEFAVPAQPVLSKETAALLEHMLAFYDRLAEQGGDDARVRRKVAEANRRVGDIRQRLGHFEESKAAYLRAIEWYTRLAEASPTDGELRTEIARVHNELGNLHLATNDFQAAYASYQSALATLQQAPADVEATSQHQFELARTYYFLGRRTFGQWGLFPITPFGRRFARFGLSGGREAMTGLPRRPRGHGPGEHGPPPGPTVPLPGSPPGRPPGASFSGPLGSPLGGPPRTPSGRPPSLPLESRGRFQVPAPGLGASPATPPLPKSSGAAPDRPAADRAASAVRRPFPFGSPEDLEKVRQREKEREENLRKAIALLERLVAEHPTAPDYRHWLARCYREAGPWWTGPGSKPVTDGVDKAAAMLQKLVEEYPDIPDYRYDLSLTLAWLSAWPFAASTSGPGAEERMRQMLEKAVVISDELIAEHPNIPEYAAFHVRLRMRLADAVWETDLSRAETSLRRAADLQATLVRRFPQSDFYRLGQAFVQESLAVFLRDRGELPEARSLTEDCITSLNTALKKDPKLWYVRGMLAQNYWNLAEIAARLHDEQAAAQATRLAEELLLTPPTPPGAAGN
jgi:serine/threonine protein kinase